MKRLLLAVLSAGILASCHPGEKVNTPIGELENMDWPVDCGNVPKERERIHLRFLEETGQAPMTLRDYDESGETEVTAAPGQPEMRACTEYMVPVDCPAYMAINGRYERAKAALNRCPQ